MHIIQKVKDWWLRIPEEKRAKIVYEIGSICNTFIAAFLIQLALDIQAAQFIIPLDVIALTSLLTAGIRAGVKGLLQMFVAWVQRRFMA